MSWSILVTQDIQFYSGGMWPTLISAVLVIQEDEMGRQRASLTDGNESCKVDIGWAWHQINS